jgi:hypothetical protein
MANGLDDILVRYNHDEQLPRSTNGGGFAPLGIIAESDLDLAVALCGKFEEVLDAVRARARARHSPPKTGLQQSVIEAGKNKLH